MKNNLSDYIINLCRLDGPISVADIAAALNQSVPSVSKYVDKLFQEQILIQNKVKISTGGRHPNHLSVNKDQGKVIAVDFGQSMFRIGITDAAANILHYEEFKSDLLPDRNHGIDIIISKLRSLIEKNILASDKLLGIGMAISGLINHDTGECYMIPNIKGWDQFNLKTILEDEFHVPVYIDDSSRTQALFESAAGPRRDRDLIYLNLGTGIGMGIVHDWQLFRGLSGLAGELGHVIVQEDGLQCGCGNRGCLEQYLALPSLVNRIKDAITKGIITNVLSFADGKTDGLDGNAIRLAYESQDKLVYSIMQEAGYYLGIALAQIITMFNPTLIVVGGGVLDITHDIIEEAKKQINIRAVNRSAKDVTIRITENGRDGALLGAALMVLDYHFRLTHFLLLELNERT